MVPILKSDSMNYDCYRLEGVPLGEHESRWKKLHLPETKEEAQRLLLMADMHGKSIYYAAKESNF